MTSDEDTLIICAWTSLVTALINNDFPVPDGPYINTPLGGGIPKTTNYHNYSNSHFLFLYLKDI